MLCEGTMFSVYLSFSQSIHSGLSAVQLRESPALKTLDAGSLFPVMHDADMMDNLDGFWIGKGPGRSCFHAAHFSNQGSCKCALLVRQNSRYMVFVEAYRQSSFLEAVHLKKPWLAMGVHVSVSSSLAGQWVLVDPYCSPWCWKLLPTNEVPTNVLVRYGGKHLASLQQTTPDSLFLLAAG